MTASVTEQVPGFTVRLTNFEGPFDLLLLAPGPDVDAAARLVRQRPPERPRLIALTAFVIASLFYLYQYVIRTAPGTFLAEIQTSMGIDLGTASGMVGALMYTYGAGCLLTGPALDKFGVRRALPLGLPAPAQLPLQPRPEPTTAPSTPSTCRPAIHPRAPTKARRPALHPMRMRYRRPTVPGRGHRRGR